MRRLWLLLGAALSILIPLSMLAASPANAITITTCPTGNAYHVWGHQWAYGNYYGQFGWFTTYEPSVPDYHQAFSLSHLYSYYGNKNPAYANTWDEVGWYKGAGNQDYNSSHYYYAWGDHGSYHEHDSSSAPTYLDSYSYQVLFYGHNYSLGTDDWRVYWNGVGTVRGTIHQSSQPYSHALAGGEVQGDSSSWTQMHTHGTPDQQIVLESYTWHNWTTYFTSTSACHSSGITYTINSKYMNFTATGRA